MSCSDGASSSLADKLTCHWARSLSHDRRISIYCIALGDFACSAQHSQLAQPALPTQFLYAKSRSEKPRQQIYHIMNFQHYSQHFSQLRLPHHSQCHSLRHPQHRSPHFSSRRSRRRSRRHQVQPLQPPPTTPAIRACTSPDFSTFLNSCCLRE